MPFSRRTLFSPGRLLLRRFGTTVQLALLCALAILPTVLVSVYVYRIARQSVVRLIESNNLLKAKAASEMLNQQLTLALRTTVAFSRSPGLVEAVKNEDEDGTAKLLQAAAGTLPGDRFEIVNLNGDLFSDYPESNNRYRPQADEEHIQKYLKNFRPAISGISQRKLEPPGPVVYITMPVRTLTKPAKNIGGLIVHLPMSQLVQQLVKIQGAELNKIILIDPNGGVVSNDIKNTEDKSGRSIWRIAAVDSAARGISSNVEFAHPVTGQSMVGHFEPISMPNLFNMPNTRWVAVSYQTTADAYEPLSRLQWQIGMSGGTIGLLTLLLFTAISRTQRSERDTEQFFRLNLDLLCIADFSGRFRKLNPSWERTLGFTNEEMRKEPFINFVHPDDRQMTIDVFNKDVKNGKTTQSFENRYRCKDGTYRWLQWSSVAAVSDGLVFAVANDISAMKLAQAELENQNRKLEQAAQNERDANDAMKNTQARLIQSERLAAIGQLVAGVAHEINNPLAFVINNLAVLQRDLSNVRDLLQLYQSENGWLEEHNPKLVAQINELSEKIDISYVMSSLIELPLRTRDGLKRIREIVSALLDSTRAQTVSQMQGEVDINSGIQSTALIIRGLAKTRGVSLDLDCRPIPLVPGDPKRLNQVILNLISNAIDACGFDPAENIRQSKKVVVRTRAVDPNHIMIQVEDNGTGITPEHASRIFEPFFTTKPQGQGTGLGLSITHGIVADHHGKIEFNSAPDSGSVFTVYLPRKYEPIPEPSADIEGAELISTSEST